MRRRFARVSLERIYSTPKFIQAKMATLAQRS